MSDLVARLHREASEYEPERTKADLFRKAADRIADLEAELAEANAKIEVITGLHARWRSRDDPNRFYCDCGCEWPCPTICALESATPKPTDNSEDAT